MKKIQYQLKLMLIVLIVQFHTTSSASEIEESFNREAEEIAENYTKPKKKQHMEKYRSEKNEARKKNLSLFNASLSGSCQSRCSKLPGLNILFTMLVVCAAMCFIFNQMAQEGVVHLQRLWAFLTMQIINIILYIVTKSKSQIQSELSKEEALRAILFLSLLFFINASAFLFTLIPVILEETGEKPGSIIDDCPTYTGSDNCKSPLAIVIMIMYVAMVGMCFVKLCL